MKTLIQIAALVILSNVAFAQSSTTNITHSDGTTSTVSCMVGDTQSNCDVKDTTPQGFSAFNFKNRKENVARGKFCKSQGLRVYQKGPITPVLTPECDAAWQAHKAEVTK